MQTSKQSEHQSKEEGLPRSVRRIEILAISACLCDMMVHPFSVDETAGKTACNL